MIPTDDQIRQSFAEGITQSEIMTRGTCCRKWMFRYILNLRKRGSFSWYLVFGDAIHRMLEEYYELAHVNGEVDPTAEIKCPAFDYPKDVILNPAQHEEAEYWKLLAEKLIQHHGRFYQKIDNKMIILQTERLLEYEYRGFRLRGVIDLGFEEDESYYVMDHKTTADITDNLILGFQFRFQFLFYSWLVRQIEGKRPAGFIVNALKKPKERRSIRNAESVQSFVARIGRNIAHEPSEYFRRIQVPLDDGMLERFQDTVLDPVITQFQWLEDATCPQTYTVFGRKDKEAMLITANTDACRQWNTVCEYLDLCCNNLEDFAGEFIQDEVKHPELEK